MHGCPAERRDDRRLSRSIETYSPSTIEGGVLAKKTILISDLTGKEINERQAAQVVIKYADARRGQIVLDVNADEVSDLAAKGVKQARRGRKPSSTGSG
jgi:hypothetical protein